MFPHPFHPLETVEEHPKEKESTSTLRRNTSFICRQGLDITPSLNLLEAVAHAADSIPSLSPLDSDSWEDLDYRDDHIINNTNQIMEKLTLEGDKDSSFKRERTSSTNSLLEEYHTIFAMKDSSSPHPLQDENNNSITSEKNSDVVAFKPSQPKKKLRKRHRRTSTHVDFDEVFSSL